MNKLMMSFVVTALCGTMVGCVGEDVEGGDEEAVAEDVSALTVGAHYCVRQSTASAYRTNSPIGPFQCWAGTTSLPINTALSFGHKVKVVYKCASLDLSESPYVNVLSLWTGSYYMMRADALSPC